MLSTLGYARIGSTISKRDKESNLTIAIHLKINNYISGLKNQSANPEDIAKMLYSSAASLMIQYNLDLSAYCECVVKAINLTQNLTNKSSIISKLAEFIEGSTKSLHDMLKKGGSLND